MNCFFLYLIGKFGNASRKSEKTLYDPILKKHVSNVVYLQNQKLLQEYIKQSIEYDQEDRLLLHQRAKAIEYMHSMFSENSIDYKTSESIGIEFIS